MSQPWYIRFGWWLCEKTDGQEYDIVAYRILKD